MENITLLLLAVTIGTTKAIQDKLQFHFENSIFSKLGNFWNPQQSWKNKWKNGNKEEGEKFFLSSTLLVSLTDAWHLFGLIRNFSIFLALGILISPMSALYYIAFILTFDSLFTYVFETKEKLWRKILYGTLAVGIPLAYSITMLFL